MVLAAAGQPQAEQSPPETVRPVHFADHTIESSPLRHLNVYLDHIWQQFFADIPCVNEVQIAYCQPWKSRLGLIRLSVDNAISFIGINALLQHGQVPEYVLITTVAHELTHYAHGFGSPLPRLYKHPHANNVVDHELEKRGLGEYVHKSDVWIDKHWFSFYDSERKSGWAGIPGFQHIGKRRQKC